MSKDIRLLSLPSITEYVLSVGEKAFRAKQIWEWLWVKSAQSFDDMSNLSKGFREKLKEDFLSEKENVAYRRFQEDRRIERSEIETALKEGEVKGLEKGREKRN